MVDTLPSLPLSLPLGLRGNPLPISDRLSRSSEDSDLAQALALELTVDRRGSREGMVDGVLNVRLEMKWVWEVYDVRGGGWRHLFVRRGIRDVQERDRREEERPRSKKRKG